MGYTISVERTKDSQLKNIDFTNLPFGRNFADHMFMADYYNGEWHDYRILPFQKYLIHPSLSALHYGQAIFEGIKAEKDPEGNPIIFRPDRNAKRFNLSAERMAMAPFPEEIFLDALDHLLAIDKDWIPATEGASLYIRPHMFATEEFVGIKPAERFRFVVFSSPVGIYYNRPVRVYIHDKYIRSFPGGVGFAKCAGNYGATLMPVKEVQKLGFDQILWLDGIHHRYLQEIGTMNIFVVIDDVLVTPSLEQGTILDGVTRSSIIQLAKDEGYKVEERAVPVDEIIDAQEKGLLNDMFGTGTAAVLSHIGEFRYMDKDYTLPPIEERTMSNVLKQRLTDIKSGKVEDIHGWLHTVPVEASVHH